jgi:hypothetical protein
MLLVCIGSCPKSVLRYKFFILDIHHPNTLYSHEQGCEDPWLFFEAKTHCIHMSKDVRIRGYFSKPKLARKQKKISNSARKDGDVFRLMRSRKVLLHSSKVVCDMWGSNGGLYQY